MHEQEMQAGPVNDRTADELEAESVKYNVARIVRLTSGAFALFTHYHSSTLSLIKVGTLEEIAPHIPTAEQCALVAPIQPRSTAGKIKSIDLADLGL
jgi:hypothetical protein